MANYPTMNRPINTPDEYRARAEECLKLASEAKEPYLKRQAPPARARR